MAKVREKRKAREMRSQGAPIGQIAKKLNVSKSSVSLWCRDIELTPEQHEQNIKNAIARGAVGRLAGVKANKLKKQKAIAGEREQAQKDVGILNSRDKFMILLGLHWGEGCKGDYGRFIFVNSDPDMILFVFKVMQKQFGIPKKRFTVGVQINVQHKYRIDTVLNFWSHLLGLPLSQFTNPYFVHTRLKKQYDNHDTYMGVARLTIRKGTRLQYRFNGYLENIKK